MWDAAYNALKDLVALAKKRKDQEMIELSLEIQTQLFDTKNESEQQRDEIRSLKNEIELILAPNLLEESIEWYSRGFFTVKGEVPKKPYCGPCWMVYKKQIPLTQVGSWFEYSCAKCQSKCVVLNEDNHQLNPLKNVPQR